MSQGRDDSLRGQYLRWEGDHRTTGSPDREGPCPVCGASIRKVAPSMRFHIVHDITQHDVKRVGYVGMPYRRSDVDMYREYGSWKERRKKEREKAARSKAASMKAQAHHEPTESEKRAKAAASQYVESQDPSPSRENA